MFRGKFSKFCALLLVFGILFSMCPVAYAHQQLPTRGEPNSTQEIYNEDGSVKRRRYYDEEGKANKDIDYNHGGVRHEFPHMHDWEWEGALPERKPQREPKKGELEKAEKITAAIAVSGTVLYYLISEGSRIVFPVRNLIPVL